MRNTRAGFRSSRPTTRFAAPTATRRERQLGLRRAARGQLHARADARAGVPALASIRRAARSMVHVRSTTAPLAGDDVPTTLRLRRMSPISWSQPNGSASRRPRPRSAAPWRG